MTPDFHTLTVPIKARISSKRSEFIAHAWPIDSRDKALFHVEQLRQHYPDANHHCWGYVVGDPNNTQSAGCDDDGEPSGTAGRPILHALLQQGIGNVVLVVVRYFGGIKLGGGGLTRAYAKAAGAALAKATLAPYQPHFTVQITTDFAGEAHVRHLLGQAGAQNLQAHYDHTVHLQACVTQAHIAALREQLGKQGQLQVL